MKATLFTVFATFSAVLFVTNSGRACSCVKVSPCEAFGSASAVFVGRMLGGAEKVSEYTKDGQTFSVEAGQSRFAVEESFKGVAATEITVFLMDMKGTSCAGMAALVRGQRYLVYASYLDSVGLAVGPCSPTKPIETAKADLEFLRALRDPGTGGRLYGQVAVETGAKEPAPLADVTVIIEDEAHGQLQVKTDRDGNFEINGLRPGKYLVNPVLPENYVFRDEHQKNRTVQVFDRGCARAPFWLNVNGRIAGKVSDSSGRPAPVYVRLESVDQRQRSFLDHTDDAGEFQIQGIPPGRYLLRIDMKKDGKESAYFYPDTNDRSKATLIDVRMGQKIEGHDFQLPPELQVVIVQGTVTYADGRAAANVEVRLIPDRGIAGPTYQVDDLYTDTETDGLGRFSVHGYKGATYRILVLDDLSRAIEEHRESGRAETEKLLLNKDVDNITVVLPLKPRGPAKQAPQKTPNAPQPN